MNLPAIIFPQEEGLRFQYRDERDYTQDRYLNVTPYSSKDRIQQALASTKIKMPFEKIVTRTDGFSTCPHCKAKYVGHQPVCTNEVTWFKTSKDSWYWKKGETFVGDVIVMDDYYKSRSAVTEVAKKACATGTNWDLEKDFTEQERFFNFAELLVQIGTVPLHDFGRYSDLLPEGATAEYRTKFLELKVQELQLQNERVFSALKMIADKMNAAGGSLMF